MVKQAVEIFARVRPERDAAVDPSQVRVVAAGGADGVDDGIGMAVEIASSRRPARSSASAHTSIAPGYEVDSPWVRSKEH
jgi:hypothetical protein